MKNLKLSLTVCAIIFALFFTNHSLKAQGGGNGNQSGNAQQHAQGLAFGHWDLAGNFATPTSRFGTLNLFPINFVTNDEQKMILTPLGRLGLGITTPEYNFHLSDDNIFSQPVFISFTNTITGFTDLDGFQFGLRPTGDAEIRLRENKTIRFFTFDQERMLISQNGKVSMLNSLSVQDFGGNNRIASFLQTQPTSDASILIRGNNLSTTADVAFLDLSNNVPPALPNGSIPYTMSRISAGSMNATGFTGHLRFYTNPGGLSGDAGLLERMRITSQGLIGVNTQTPSDRFEINAGTGSSIPGASGLTFTELDANSTAATSNSTNTVLSVNDDGNVILVEDEGEDDDWERDGDDIFTGTIGTNVTTLPTGNIGVGLKPSLAAKLDLLRPLTLSVINPTALNILNEDVGLFKPRAFGLRSRVTGANVINIAGHFTSEGASTNIGGQFFVTKTAQSNIGGDFRASGAPIGKNIAAQFRAPGGVPGTTLQNIAIDVVSGVAQKPDGPDWSTPSDSRLKTDISLFTDGLNVIRSINPKFFRYNGKAETPTNNLYIGLIAQDLQQIAPYAVDTFFAKLDSTDSTATALLRSNTGPLFFALINAAQELDSARIADKAYFQSKIDSLIILYNQCCTNNSFQKTVSNNNEQDNFEGARKMLQVETDVLLYQNNPNPFSESTTINYRLPDESNNGTIIIYDMQGRQIKEYSSLQKGNGSVIINGGELYPGMFLYSFIVDGKEIDTKRMILTKNH